MKKLFVFLLTICIFLTNGLLFCEAAFTKAKDTHSEIVYMYSLDAERTVIYDKNSDVLANCASLAKIVTARIVIDECEDYTMPITAASDAIRPLDNVSCTRVGILVGEVISVQELLYCLMIANAADAGNVLAYHFGGESITAFVDKMNDYVKSLGCENTVFADPNGLKDGQQFTTAKEMAMIYEDCLNNDYFAQIASMDYYKMPATNKYYETRYLHTTNLCMDPDYSDYYCSEVINGKVATDSNDVGYAVSTATNDGYSYLCVVLNGPQKDYDEDGKTENTAMVDTAKLYDWLFDTVKLRVVAKNSTVVGEVKVNHSADFDYVSLVPMMDVSALVPEGIDTESVYIKAIPELTKTEVDAPIHKGDVLGTAAILYADEEIARVDLVASFDVEVSYSQFLIQSVRDIITHPVFIIIVIVILVALAVFGCYFFFVPGGKKFRKNNVRIIKGYEVMNKKSKSKRGDK